MKQLTPRQVTLLSTLLTQVLVEPTVLRTLMEDPRGSLLRAGFQEEEIADVSEYVKQLQEVLQTSMTAAGSFWM